MFHALSIAQTKIVIIARLVTHSTLLNMQAIAKSSADMILAKKMAGNLYGIITQNRVELKKKRPSINTF
jgi:hypothetical protein